MRYAFDDEEFEWFKNEFYKLSNLQLNKYKQDQMKRRVSNYIFRRNNSNYQDFLETIKHDSDAINIAAALEEKIGFVPLNLREGE